MKKKLKLAFSVFCILSTVYCLITIGKVHAQEAVEIPGPEIKNSSFIQVKDLNIGDVVFVKSETGELVSSTITKLEYQQEPVEVYNLSVDGEQTFFANGFAVHNKPAAPESPECRIVISQQIVADGKMATYNPYDPSHQDSGLVSFNKLSTISGKDLFYMGRIPFEMDPLYPLEQVASVCFFGHSNRVPDYGGGDDRHPETCGGNPINQPPLSRGLGPQNAGGACRGRWGEGGDWYLHPLSGWAYYWGCPYCPANCAYNAYQGNFLWLYGGAHVTINPPANNLVYKISFNYNVTSGSIIFSRHYRTEGTKVYWNPLAGGTITGSGNDKVVFLSPASDSLHILAQGDALLSNIQVTFINISSATGTVDNKVTIVNNSYGNKNSSGPAQGVGNVWLSNTSINGPWTQVVNANVDWLAGRSDYIRMGYEWDLGSGSGTRTVWARVEGVGQNVGKFSTCPDAISFTPANAPPDCTSLTLNGGHSTSFVLNPGETISLAAQPTDTDGTVKEVRFYSTTNFVDTCKDWKLIGTDTNGSDGWTATWTPDPEETFFIGGLYYVFARVRDDKGVWCDNPKICGVDGATTRCSTDCRWVGTIEFIADPWFQTKEGDVHAQEGTISSPIYPEDEYFCAADTGSYPGVVSYNSSTEPDFGQGSVSEKGWLANDSLSLSSGYDSFYSKLGSPTEDNFSCETACPSPPLGETTVYYSADTVTVGNDWDISDNANVIVLIDGDLEINKEIHVTEGSFLAFIVSGDIKVEGNVGQKPGQQGFADPDVEGVYIAEGSFWTNVGEVESGKQFRGAGVFIASNFELDRDLKEEFNDEYPAELFIARPDLFINIPEELKTSYFFEQEVAP